MLHPFYSSDRTCAFSLSRDRFRWRIYSTSGNQGGRSYGQLTDYRPPRKRLVTALGILSVRLNQWKFVPIRAACRQTRYVTLFRNLALAISQERFAAQIGSTRATVWHWVNGRRTPSYMACKFMRLVADEFAISIPEDQELTTEAV